MVLIRVAEDLSSQTGEAPSLHFLGGAQEVYINDMQETKESLPSGDSGQLGERFWADFGDLSPMLACQSQVCPERSR